jgi:nucleoid-associated protein EbfC
MNIADLMKAAQGMQSKMADAQAALDTILVTGESGGGLVKVTATAKGRITALAIDPSLIVPSDKEILEDLIVAALASAQRRAEDTAQAEMAKITQGLPLPPGMKLPF